MRTFKTLTVAVAFAAFAAGTSAQAAKWKVDKVHSSVGFKVSHLVISNTKGVFKEFSGDIEFDPDDLSSGKVEFTVDAASIFTDNEDRDKHLRSPEFLDTEKFKTITFKSKKVGPVKDGKFTLTGDLTLHGVTKEVTFDCEFGGVVEAFGMVKAGFTAKTTINRQDFGVSYSKVLDNGGLAVGNDVEITLELELNKVEPKNPCNPCNPCGGK